MIYYTADLHLGHENILKHCSRPFKTIAEMNRVLIDNWNSIVTDKDDIYAVGDLAFRSDKSETLEIIKKLKGRKYLAVGNHDGKLLNYPEFAELFSDIKDIFDISDNGRRVIICHYPILEWDGFFRGSYHIYGHIHNGSPDAAAIMKTRERAFNAGVDLNDFIPQTLDMMIRRKEAGMY